ncbi:hypothetical protein CRUP_038081, partial [Coryphaenoides rupestris]
AWLDSTCRTLGLFIDGKFLLPADRQTRTLTGAKGEQVKTPGSSVTFWTPEMRGGSDDDVLWQHGADRLLCGLYTVEVNGSDVAKFPLRVISPVPVPRVSEACRPEGDTRVFCSLTCEGDTAGAEPVRYLWHHPHANISTRTKTINTTVSVGVSSVGVFRCTMENDVSAQMSPADLTPSPENDKPGDVCLTWILPTVLLVLVVLVIGSVVIYHRLWTVIYCCGLQDASDENGNKLQDIKQPDNGQPQQSGAEQGLLHGDSAA